DCQCCRDYYDAAGPVAVRPYEDKISRHRDYGPPPSTPEGFWEIGFPDTQMVAKTNRSADAADRKKRE
ncbi:uncharacterized protein FA14DRAFT_116384, partial [Meira miltonrushii]